MRTALQPIRALYPGQSSSCLARAPIGLASRPRVRVVWTPNPGAQIAFLACPVEWALFGGQLGGGKTDSLLADYLHQVDKNGYNGLFLRKSYPELLQVIRRSQQMYGPLGGKYNKSEKLWKFPSGATLRFGYVTNYEDALRYASDEYQWLAIDEATHIPYEAFELLTTRVRGGEALGLKCYVRLSANPNGRHMLWVRKLFIDGKEPLTEYHDETTGVTVVFIPSTLAPQLQGTGYERRLKILSPKEYAALALGDWYAYEGQIFTLIKGIHTWSLEEFKERTGHATPPQEWTRIRVMDWGFAKPFAIYWLAVDYTGRAYCYREWYGVASDGNSGFTANKGLSMEPKLVAQKIARIEKDASEHNVTGFADPACWSKGQGDHGGGPSVTEVMAGEGVYWSKAKNDRISGKMAVHERLFFDSTQPAPEKWPGLVFLTPAIVHAIRTIPMLVYDKHIPEDVDTEGEDHAYDTIRYFCMARPWKPIPKKKPDGWREREAGGPDWMVG